MTRNGLARALTALAVAALAVLCVAAAGAAMRSEKLGPRLCETTGGGRFVHIPDFPGEKIDRRLLADIRYIRNRWPIMITDGHSLDPVHSANGEHPVGLALDIVPNTAEGGRWRHIDQLAEWAEPKQNRPRAPFRWVGYDGDANHGRGHHLHLSWSHSPSQYDRPARVVYTLVCPGAAKPPDDDDPAPGSTGGVYGEGGRKSGGGGNGSGGISTGGIAARRGDTARAHRIDRIHRETGGVSAP